MTTLLDRKSFQPLYMQLVRRLRGVVLSVDADTKFATEREISEEYGVSRFTVVKAVNQLVQEGHLYRIQGKGTFRSGQLAAPKHGERKTALLFLPRPLTELVSRNDYIMAEMAQGVLDSLGRDANLAVSAIPRDEDEAKFCAERISHPSTDGLILFPWMNVRALVRLATNLRKPFVLLNVKHEYALALNAVLADEAEGARRMTRYLLDQGHRSIVYVTGTAGAPHPPGLALTDRLAGHRQALEEAGVPFDLGRVVRWSGPQADADVTVIEELVSDETRRPTALFVANDLVAERVLAMLRRRGIRVPEDMSVVGYDDAPCAARTDPPLTTVSKPRHEMGVAAGELLLRMLREGFSLGATEVLGTTPVIRATAGPVPAAYATPSS